MTKLYNMWAHLFCRIFRLEWRFGRRTEVHSRRPFCPGSVPRSTWKIIESWLFSKIVRLTKKMIFEDDIFIDADRDCYGQEWTIYSFCFLKVYLKGVNDLMKLVKITLLFISAFGHDEKQKPIIAYHCTTTLCNLCVGKLHICNWETW